MPSVETICSRQWSDPDFRQKWLIGGLIASIPILNILFLGYGLNYVRALRRGENLELPDWADWRSLLIDGLHMLALIVLYVGIPAAIGAGISWLLVEIFDLIWLDLFASTIAILPATLGVFAGWFLWMAAVQHFLRREDWREMLNWQRTFRIAQRIAAPLIFPSLAFCGLITIGWPLLGFTIFLGLMPSLAYATAVYLNETGAVS